MAARKATARSLFVTLHLYVGLILGLLVAVVAVSGSVIVYWKEIDGIVHARPKPSVKSGEMRLLEELLASALEGQPERPNDWTLTLPEYPGAPAVASYMAPEEKGGGYGPALYIEIDPYTGERLSHWYWGETVGSWFYNIHMMLLVGYSGHVIIGVSGYILLFLLVTGIYLWWPRGNKFAKHVFAINTKTGPARFEFDLHRILGLYSLIIMLVLTVTGINYVFPRHVSAVAGLVSEMDKPPSGLESTFLSSSAQKLSMDDAAAVATVLFPDAQLMRVTRPAREGGVFVVNLKQPEEYFQDSYPKTKVWIDQYSGAVLHVNDPTSASGGQKFVNAFGPFHDGAAFGAIGRFIVFVSGIVLTIMFVTGVTQWLRKEKLKKDRAKMRAQKEDALAS